MNEYMLETPANAILSITGFKLHSAKSFGDGCWKIKASLLTSSLLADNTDRLKSTVEIKPITTEVVVSKMEVAEAIGVDTMQDGWDLLYEAKTIADLKSGVIIGAQTKVLGLFLISDSAD